MLILCVKQPIVSIETLLRFRSCAISGNCIRKLGGRFWTALFGDDVPHANVTKYTDEIARLMMQLELAEREFCLGMRKDEDEKSFEIYIALPNNVAAFAELALANTVRSFVVLFGTFVFL